MPVLLHYGKYCVEEIFLVINRKTLTNLSIFAPLKVLFLNQKKKKAEKCDYKLPFEEEVGLNPSLDDMKEVVVDKGQRPIIKPEWIKHHVINV